MTARTHGRRRSRPGFAPRHGTSAAPGPVGRAGILLAALLVGALAFRPGLARAEAG